MLFFLVFSNLAECLILTELINSQGANPVKDFTFLYKVVFDTFNSKANWSKVNLESEIIFSILFNANFKKYSSHLEAGNKSVWF